jgi:hypothetical protein
LPASTAPSSIGKIPASCGDLQQIGHKKSGLYSVMGSNKIQTVYCDFTKSPSDSGTANSKTKIAYSVKSILKNVIQQLCKNGSDLRTFNPFPPFSTFRETVTSP